jgi:hypothetical protein
VRLRPRRPALSPPRPAAHCSPPTISDFEQEINQLRTHQGQSDVYVINEGHDPGADLRRRRQLAGHRGARRRRDHLVGLRRQPALREDEGGGAICFKHWLRRPTCCSSSAASRTTPTSSRPSARWPTRCASTSARTGRRRCTSWSAAAGRTWCAAWALRDTCEALGLPYRFFGFDSAMSEVVQYAKRVDAWMKAGGREQVAATDAQDRARARHLIQEEKSTCTSKA